MQLLVVCKTTNLELYRATVEAKIRQGLAAEDWLTRLQVEHDEHHRCLDALRIALQKAGISFLEISRDDQWPVAKEFDAVLSVGGDGTLLSASHHLTTGGRLVGIRSSRASVGFLCSVDVNTIDLMTRNLLAGGLDWRETARLQVQITKADGTKQESAPVLNDILYANTHPAATTRYQIDWRELSEEHRSSGIWFATAAGSTAGIKAAGGQQVPIGSKLYQFRVRELYHPPGIPLRIQGGFFKASEELRVTNFNESALVALDGQHGKLDLQYGDQFQVVTGPCIDIAGVPR